MKRSVFQHALESALTQREKCHIVFCLFKIVHKNNYMRGENVSADCLNHTQSNATKLGNEDLLNNPSVKCSGTFLGHNLWWITPLRHLELQAEEMKRLLPVALHIKSFRFCTGYDCTTDYSGSVSADASFRKHVFYCSWTWVQWAGCEKCSFTCRTCM